MEKNEKDQSQAAESAKDQEMGSEIPAAEAGAAKKSEINLPENKQNNPDSIESEYSDTSKIEQQQMSGTRDSIYNVSSDIRLEDYAEKIAKHRKPVSTMKMAALGIVAMFVFYAIYRFFAFIYAPEYKLAIANEYIDDTNVLTLTDVKSVSAAKPVYIRFQWVSGELETDYLRIQIHKITSEGKKEEAVLGRRKPLTANYVYFMGPLEAGDYTLEVVDREGGTLKTKNFHVR